MHRQVRNKQSGKAVASGKVTLKKGVDLIPVTGRNLKKKQIRLELYCDFNNVRIQEFYFFPYNGNVYANIDIFSGN